MAVLFSVALCNSMYALYALLLYIAKFNVENVDQNPSNGDTFGQSRCYSLAFVPYILRPLVGVFFLFAK